MSSKYPIITPREVIKILSKFGFYKISQKGSHVKFKNDFTNRTFIIPMHDEVAKGTLKSILEQADVTIEEFLNKF